MSTAKKLLPVSLFYNANVAFALASLKGVNIPMYIAIKRLTPLAVLIAGFVSGKGKPTIQVPSCPCLDQLVRCLTPACVYLNGLFYCVIKLNDCVYILKGLVMISFFFCLVLLTLNLLYPQLEHGQDTI